MAQFTHSLCEEVIRTNGRVGLSDNEKLQMALLALRALKNENPWKDKYLKLVAGTEPQSNEGGRNG